MRSGQDVENVQIVISRTLAAMTGRTVDEQGEAVHATVLLFPTDPARWHPDGDTCGMRGPINTARSGWSTSGQASIWWWHSTTSRRAEFLESVRRRAAKIQVVDGEPEPLTLRVLR